MCSHAPPQLRQLEGQSGGRRLDLLLHGFIFIDKRAKRTGLFDRYARDPLLKSGELLDSGTTRSPNQIVVRSMAKGNRRSDGIGGVS